MRSIQLQLVSSTKLMVGAMYYNQQIHQKHISKSFFSLWVYFGCIPVTKRSKLETMRSIQLQLVPSTKLIVGAMYKNQQIHQKHICKSFFSLWVYFGCIPVTKRSKLETMRSIQLQLVPSTKLIVGANVLEPTDSQETDFQVIVLTLGVFSMHSCH